MHFSRLSCVLLFSCTVAVQMNAKKTYRWSRGTAPHILYLGTTWRWAAALRRKKMGLRAGLGDLDKIKTACPCQESNPESSSPQPGQYDYTTPAPTFSKEENSTTCIQDTRALTWLKIMQAQWFITRFLVVPQIRHSGLFCLRTSQGSDQHTGTFSLVLDSHGNATQHSCSERDSNLQLQRRRHALFKPQWKWTYVTEITSLLWHLRIVLCTKRPVSYMTSSTNCIQHFSSTP